MSEPIFFDDYLNLITSIDNMTKSKEGFGYKYVELTPLLEEVLPKVHEHNFILIQSVKQVEGEYYRKIMEPAIYEDKKKGTRNVEGEVYREIRTPAFVLHSELLHASGQKIECDMPLYVDDTDPQALGSAETYMRRYSIYALLHIKTEDDDGAAGSAKAKTRKKEPETFADFVLEIANTSNPKALGALYYKWREKWAEGTEEYKNLNKFSGNCKLKLLGENVQDIYFGCSEIVKTIVEGN